MVHFSSPAVPSYQVAQPAIFTISECPIVSEPQGKNTKPAESVLLSPLYFPPLFSLVVCGDKNAGSNYEQDIEFLTSIALLGCIKAKKQHVFCLIKIPLVLTFQTSNASVPEITVSYAKTGQPPKRIPIKYVILVMNCTYKENFSFIIGNIEGQCLEQPVHKLL